MSDCRFGVSPVNYPDPDPDPRMMLALMLYFFIVAHRASCHTLSKAFLKSMKT